MLEIKKTRTESETFDFKIRSTGSFLPITIRIAARFPAFLLVWDLLLTEERLFCLILL